ncbi:MAG: cell division/cell wall cluster transcriptional repressor MraZ [Clostridiales bacterium]|nr:cell division/cell wall cluster transcriptional repressor MraZ [Clostridiales bacterium]
MNGAEFSGNYTHTIDPKGRVTIPSAYRGALGEGFTIGLNNEFNAIALYPVEKWDEIGTRLDRIPDSDARGMAYVRLIKAFSFTGQRLDQQGRVLLPPALRKKADMDKAIRFVGVGRYLEIWDEDKFAATCELAERDIESLLEYVNDRYYSPKD